MAGATVACSRTGNSKSLVRSLADGVGEVLKAQAESGKPLAIVLAGHNGSGKSTLWYKQLAPTIQIPLINADRMMMSILPEVSAGEEAAGLGFGDQRFRHKLDAGRPERGRSLRRAGHRATVRWISALCLAASLPFGAEQAEDKRADGAHAGARADELALLSDTRTDR